MKRNRKIKFQKSRFDYEFGKTYLQDTWRECTDSYLIQKANDVLNECRENEPHKDFEVYIRGLKYDGYGKCRLIVQSNKRDFIYFAQLFILTVGKYIEKVEF